MLLAYGLLVGICVQDQQAHPLSEEPVGATALIALTTREVRHLLARLIWPAPSCAPLICRWSQWRRTHQYWAGYYHRRRRLKRCCVEAGR